MTEKNKPRIDYVLDALLTGKSLQLDEIRKIVADLSGEIIENKHIAPSLTKITDQRGPDISHFIMKTKKADGYEYSIAPEILGLTAEEMYGLVRKRGKNRFTLEMALKKIPELKKYVKNSTRQEMVSPMESATDISHSATESENDMPEETPIQRTTLSHLKGIFDEETRRAGGLKLNFYFTAQVL